MMGKRDRPLADGRPHAADDRLQADAMLVRRPDLELRVQMLAMLGSDGALKLFFEPATVLFACRLRMPRARLLDRVADGNEGVPAALIVHRFEPW